MSTPGPDEHRPATRAPAAYGWPVAPERPEEGAPAPVPEVPAPAAHRFTAAQAQDPATDLALLATICVDAPELRPHVAANPAAYPALLRWLAGLGDERVDRALRSRPAR